MDLELARICLKILGIYACIQLIILAIKGPKKKESK